MKHIKALGLLAVVAAAMMVFAASASADTSTTTETDGSTNATPTIHLVNEGGHVTIQNPIANISCSLTARGTVTTHVAGQPVFGHFSELLFTGCTNSWHVTTENPGTFAIEASNGEMRSNALKVDATRFGITCVYETKAVKIGTVTGGSPATLHIEGSLEIGPESHPFCGAGTSKWEGDLVTTRPLHFDNN